MRSLGSIACPRRREGAPRARSEAYATRHDRRESALSRIKVRSVQVMGKPGLRAVGTHFEIYSTCDDLFVREVTYYLDEVFAAYRQSFEIQRNAERRVRVYLLADLAEYKRFQQAQLGGVVLNPAFYHIKKNFIAAYDMVQKDEAAAIRVRILALEKEIRKSKDQIKEREDWIKQEGREARKKINTEAARARREVQRGNPANRTALLRKVDEWKKERFRLVSNWEKDQRKKLKQDKARIAETISHNRGIIAANNRVREQRNARMFEMLFHEGFHAFARNFLWQRKGETAVPRWLDEGLASYYERSVVEAGELIHGSAHPAFLARVQRSRAEGKLIGLDQLIDSSGAQFLAAHVRDQDRAGLHYAQAWALTHYMVGRVSRERMEAYVKLMLAGADNRKAFETMMGEPIDQVDFHLRQHLASLR